MKNLFNYCKSRFDDLDIPLLMIVLSILFLSCFTVYSASMGTPIHIKDQFRNILICFIMLWVVAQIPAPVLIKLAPFLYAIGVTLLVMVAMFGLVKKGARRWLNVGVIIQPSEMLKIATPMMLAWYLDKKENAVYFRHFIVSLIILAIPVGLIVKQPDLGTAILVLMSGLYILYFAGLSWRLIVPIIALGLAGMVAIIIFSDGLCHNDVSWQPWMHDYQKHRICTLLNPASDPLGKGFHIIQSMIAIGSGGIFGKGWLKGTQSHLEFVPEKHTDFIFAVYSEEFGFFGNIILMILYILLIFRCLIIAHKAQAFFARLLASALSLMFFTYAFVNMGMVSGILPVVGVPLPFMSYGGTAMATLGMCLGVLMSISRHYAPKRGYNPYR